MIHYGGGQTLNRQGSQGRGGLVIETGFNVGYSNGLRRRGPLGRHLVFEGESTSGVLSPLRTGLGRPRTST